MLAFDDTTLANDNDSLNRAKRNGHRKYFLPRVNISDYNILINGNNFYDQPLSDQIKKHDEIIKIDKASYQNFDDKKCKYSEIISAVIDMKQVFTERLF